MNPELIVKRNGWLDDEDKKILLRLIFLGLTGLAMQILGRWLHRRGILNVDFVKTEGGTVYADTGILGAAGGPLAAMMTGAALEELDDMKERGFVFPEGQRGKKGLDYLTERQEAMLRADVTTYAFANSPMFSGGAAILNWATGRSDPAKFVLEQTSAMGRPGFTRDINMWIESADPKFENTYKFKREEALDYWKYWIPWIKQTQLEPVDDELTGF